MCNLSIVIGITFKECIVVNQPNPNNEHLLKPDSEKQFLQTCGSTETFKTRKAVNCKISKSQISIPRNDVFTGV